MDDRHLEAKEIHTRIINCFWMRVRCSSHQNATSNHGGHRTCMGHTLTDYLSYFFDHSLYIKNTKLADESASENISEHLFLFLKYGLIVGKIKSFICSLATKKNGK